jgi:hypothetical protein
VTNQEWVIAEEDELTCDENGIPLFVDGDDYVAHSMPSWNGDGTAVTFWEDSNRTIEHDHASQVGDVGS